MSTELTREVRSISMWSQSSYRIKRPFWSFLERTFRVFTMDGQLIMKIRHPLMRLREAFNVYADEGETQPILQIRARQMIAINFTFDVVDTTTGAALGTVQKRGMRSIVRDKFLILDPSGVEIGMMEEQGASVLRRFIPILTSKHSVFINGQEVGRMRQIFRFFTKEFEIHIAPGQADPRFILACALLALMAEARREDR